MKRAKLCVNSCEAGQALGAGSLNDRAAAEESDGVLDVRMHVAIVLQGRDLRP